MSTGSIMLDNSQIDFPVRDHSTAVEDQLGTPILKKSDIFLDYFFDREIVIPSEWRDKCMLYDDLKQDDYKVKESFIHGPKPPIKFRIIDGLDFVPLRDLLEDGPSRRSERIERRSEAAFDDAANMSHKHTFRLQVVGQKRYNRQLTTRDSTKDVKSVTVEKLALMIAQEVKEYLAKHCADNPLNLDVKRLVLVEYKQVSPGSWQPVLGVLRPGIDLWI